MASNEDAGACKDALENLHTRKITSRRTLTGILSKNSGVKPNLRGSLPKTGPLRFGSENQFPLNFAHEYILVQK